MDLTEQVQQSLLYAYKLSEIELKACREFGVSRFSNREEYNLKSEEITAIRQLHKKIKDIYSEDFGVYETA